MIKIIYTVILLFLIVFYAIAPTDMNKSIMLGLLIIVIAVLSLFGFSKEKIIPLRKNYLKHSFLFLVGFCIVHFQYYIDYILGNVNSEQTEIWINKEIVIKAMILCCIGLVCFLLGYLLNNHTSINRKIVSKREITQSVRLLEIAAAICLALYFYFINPLFLLGNYGVVDKGYTAAHIGYLFEFIIFAAIIQISRNLFISKIRLSSFYNYLKQFGWLTNSMLFTYLFSVLISGARMPLIQFSVFIFGSYVFVSKKKIDLRKALVFLCLASLIIFTLKKARAQRDVDYKNRFFTALSIENPYSSNTFSPLTQELAGSIQCLHYSMNYVPKHEYFMLGRFQFQEATLLVPFFSGINKLIFNDKPSDKIIIEGKTDFLYSKYLGSALFISWIAEGSFPSKGYGTTVVADFYLDFGLIGVIIGLFIIGYLMRSAEIIMYSYSLPSLFMQCFCLVYLSDCIYICRTTFLSSLQTVFWIYFTLLLNRLLFQKRLS